MQQQIYHGLPYGTLDKFHEFRESNFDYTYLCKRCIRGFDARKPEQMCKFCGGDVIEIRSVHRKRQGLKKTVTYKNFCTTCDKMYTSSEQLAICNNCRTDYMHVYPWELLRRRDKLYIKTQRAFRNVVLNKKVSGKRQDVSDVTGNGEDKNIKSERKIKIPRIKISFSRNHEELPTY